MREDAPQESVVLVRLRAGLADVTEVVGLELVETSTADEVAWLEYRRADADGPLVLTVTYRADDQTICAELWRPSRLTAALMAGDLDQAIDASRIWQRGPEAVLDGLIDEIRGTVRNWLEPGGPVGRW